MMIRKKFLHDVRDALKGAAMDAWDSGKLHESQSVSLPEFRCRV